MPTMPYLIRPKCKGDGGWIRSKLSATDTFCSVLPYLLRSEPLRFWGIYRNWELTLTCASKNLSSLKLWTKVIDKSEYRAAAKELNRTLQLCRFQKDQSKFQPCQPCQTCQPCQPVTHQAAPALICTEHASHGAACLYSNVAFVGMAV
jgi:hypothetical protein